METKTTTLEEKHALFETGLLACQTFKERQQFCTAFKDNMLTYWSKETRLSRMTGFRKILIRLGLKPLLRYLSLTKDSRRKASKYGRVIKKRTEKGDLEKVQILDCKGLIQQAKDFLLSSSYQKIAVGLCLLTGRRCAEILGGGSFKKAKTLKNNILTFYGQLKLKNRIEKPYNIPTLAPANDILAAVQKLRDITTDTNRRKGAKDFSKLTAEQIHSLTAKTLNDLVKKEFAAWLGTDVTPHDLRKAYAAIGYAYYEKAGGQSGFRDWAKDMLGHGGDTLTTEAYGKYKAII